MVLTIVTIENCSAKCCTHNGIIISSRVVDGKVMTRKS